MFMFQTMILENFINCGFLIIAAFGLFSYYLVYALECKQRGLLDNKIQCLFHDRGIVVGGILVSKDVESERKKAESEKYSKGLDNNKTFFEGSTEEEFKDQLHRLIPETRWCGEREIDSTISYEYLLSFIRVDKCCKKHDNCSSVLEIRQRHEHIVNTGVLKRFHCDCEKDFYQCLKKDNSGLANRIGKTYFTIYGPQCFREDNPKTSCMKMQFDRCLGYKYNRTENVTTQWFDLPVF